MCGIAGIVSFSSQPQKTVVMSMCDKIAHRGPDSYGFAEFNNAILGARRLSVIDISDKGNMPIYNETNDMAIVYNGELYNFQQLQKELKNSGHIFKSNTDTEVVLHAYEEWGEECLKKFNGMFVFVIWDEKNKTAFVARDRMGVKPFFYCYDGASFIFCSELHPLFDHMQPSKDIINRDSLDYYLAYAYVPPDTTFIKGFKKLPPATKIKLTSETILLEKYWNIEFFPKHKISEDEAYEEVDRILNEAVKKRLVSDVPLGCFLSGGIDSSLVTAIAARNSSSRIKTFSVGFPGGNIKDDERPLAKLVSDMYNTEHTELEVGTEGKDILPEILWHYGEPFADLSALAVYQISKAARQHITVALSGDGGDESFCGYANIRAAYLAEMYKNAVPGGIHNLIRKIVSLPTLTNNSKIFRKAHSWLGQYVDRDVLGHYDLQNHWHKDIRQMLYGGRFEEAQFSAENMIKVILENTDKLAIPEKHLYTDLQYRLPGDYLTKVDIASNMCSLEVRSPFLDYELVEFMAKLPINIKMKFGKQKYMLRKLAQKYLPKELINQPKRGFGPSLTNWLRGDWASLMERYIAEKMVSRKLFSEDVLKRVVYEHLDGSKDHKTRLWTMFCLELWFEMFVDKSLKPGDPL